MSKEAFRPASSRPTDDRVVGLVAAWAARNPRSAAHSARARHLLPGGVTHDIRLAEPFPLAVARAAGSRKWDLDGHELICYVMGHGSLLAGHCHPAVVAAVREQAGRSFHPGACHELESDWADAVIRLVPSAERCGVGGRAYGERSVFHLLFGPEAPEQRGPAVLRAGLPAPLSSALHCGTLLEGVHLFHGSGFLSIAHSESDVERTVDALAATLPRLAAEGLV